MTGWPKYMRTLPPLDFSSRSHQPSKAVKGNSIPQRMLLRPNCREVSDTRRGPNAQNRRTNIPSSSPKIVLYNRAVQKTSIRFVMPVDRDDCREATTLIEVVSLARFFLASLGQSDISETRGEM